jgi:HPt (histidine-containing phosphotransfer) domain-containing protein
VVDEPILDLATLDALADLAPEDRASFLHELITMYLADTPQRLMAIRDACARADLPALQRVIHTLKGSSVTIGALDLAHRCAELEERLRAGTAVPEEQAVQGIMAAFDRLQPLLLTLEQRYKSGGA